MPSGPSHDSPGRYLSRRPAVHLSDWQRHAMFAFTQFLAGSSLALRRTIDGQPISGGIVGYAAFTKCGPSVKF
jgi:hypothetical protein